MTTTVQQIFDGALDRNLFNDSDLVNYPRAIAWLDRLVKRLYGEASAPVQPGTAERDDFFVARTTLTLLAAFTALPTAVKTAVWLPPRFLTAAGKQVRLVSQAELAESVAELAPALIWEGRQVSPTGRSGDLTVGNVVTILYVPAPATMSDTAHYIGASTATDSTTTIWPDQPGNEALVAELALYLAKKDGGIDPQEIVTLEKEAAQHSTALMAFLRGRA